MNRKLGVFVLTLLFVTTLASAEIFLSKQPSDTYSLGDTMQIVLGSDGTPGWASIDLSCANKTKMLSYHYLTGADTKTEISVPLTKDFLRGLSGQCNLLLAFGNETKKSMDFTIYEQIYVDIKFNALYFEPNSTLSYSGTASKPNKQEVNGFAEISVENTALESVVPVVKSKFSGEFEIPEGLAAGKYIVNVFIYEQTENKEVTNYGYSNTSISISQKAEELEIDVPETSDPDSSLEFKAVLKDHTGQTINSVPVSFKLINARGEKVLDILSETDKINYFKLQKNAPLGYWNMTAESKGAKQEAQIYISENKEASFEVENGTLTITNIGNIGYDNPVEVAIGEHSKVMDINLSLGQSRSFELEAPDGEYNVSVSDGSKSYAGIVALTGDAIAIKGPNGSFNFINKGIVAWTFLILILGMFIFISSKRIITKKQVFSAPVKGYSRKNLGGGGVLKVNPSKSGKLEKDSTEARHSLVIDGSKQASSIITLKIKNNEEIKNSGMDISDHVRSISEIIAGRDGRIYKSGDYIIGIFAPVITRTFENNLTALKSAKRISDELNSFNKIAKVKIKFGIAVSAGDIIARKHDGALLFTPVGNILINSKKISEISENNLLISEEANKKLMTKAKTLANPEKFGIKTYSLKELLDTQENTKFINSFLKRNDYKSLDKFRV